MNIEQQTLLTLLFLSNRERLLLQLLTLGFMLLETEQQADIVNTFLKNQYTEDKVGHM